MATQTLRIYPNTFLDITPVFEKKSAAMEVMGAQGYLHEYYFQRASQRANRARRICGDKGNKFAEALQRVTLLLKGDSSALPVWC